MTSFEAFGRMRLGHTATKAEAKAAFRTYAKLAHPDCGGTPEAFRELKEAFDVVMRVIAEREQAPRRGVELHVGNVIFNFTSASNSEFYSDWNYQAGGNQ